MARDFQTFLNQLEASGELRRVAAEVDPYPGGGGHRGPGVQAARRGLRLRSTRIQGAPCRWP